MDLKTVGYFEISPSDEMHRRHGKIRIKTFGVDVYCDSVDEAVSFLKELAKKTTSREQVLEGFKLCGLIS